jgi:hypothetical protein
MRRTLSVLSAAMVIVVLTALPAAAQAGPPQEGEVVGGGPINSDTGIPCRPVQGTSETHCSGGGGGHVVGTQGASGSGGHFEADPGTGDTTSFSGGGTDGQGGGVGGRCEYTPTGDGGFTQDCTPNAG